MRLATILVRGRGHGSFELHVEVAEDAVAKVLEAVASVVWVVVIRAPIDDQLVVAVHGIVELWGSGWRRSVDGKLKLKNGRL